MNLKRQRFEHKPFELFGVPTEVPSPGCDEALVLAPISVLPYVLSPFWPVSRRKLFVVAEQLRSVIIGQVIKYVHKFRLKLNTVRTLSRLALV